MGFGRIIGSIVKGIGNEILDAVAAGGGPEKVYYYSYGDYNGQRLSVREIIENGVKRVLCGNLSDHDPYLRSIKSLLKDRRAGFVSHYDVYDQLPDETDSNLIKEFKVRVYFDIGNVMRLKISVFPSIYFTELA